MSRYGWLVTAVLALIAGSGCYYDNWKACERSLRAAQEDLSRTKTDLLDCEHMNKQKDTQIEALQNQKKSLEEQNASLTAENEGLRKALEQAQGIAETIASKQIPGVTILQGSQLPPQVVSAIKELADKYPDILEFDEKTGAVRWKADLLFPLGSDVVATNEKIQEALRRFAEIVKSPAARDLDLVIVGHTDTTPIRKAETLREHKTNWGLSAHRAIAVMKILAGVGVSENRMGVMGYGEFRPIADNSTPEGKARNRRVEIFLVSKGSVQSVSGKPGVYNSDEAGTFVKPSDVGGTGTPAPGVRRAPAGRGARAGTVRTAPVRPPAAPKAGEGESTAPAPVAPPATPSSEKEPASGQ